MPLGWLMDGLSRPTPSALPISFLRRFSVDAILSIVRMRLSWRLDEREEVDSVWVSSEVCSLVLTDLRSPNQYHPLVASVAVAVVGFWCFSGDYNNRFIIIIIGFWLVVSGYRCGQFCVGSERYPYEIF